MIIRLLVIGLLVGFAYFLLTRNRSNRNKKTASVLRTIAKTAFTRIDTNQAGSSVMSVRNIGSSEWLVNDLKDDQFRSIQQELKNRQDDEGLFWLHWKAVEKFGAHHHTPVEGLPSQCPTISTERALFILGLDPDPSSHAIQTQFRKYMQHSHPDQGGHPVLSIALNKSRKKLSELP